MPRLLPAVLMSILALPLAAEPLPYADLEIATSAPARMPVTSDGYVSVVVRNHGPDAARDVVLTTSAGRFRGTKDCVPGGNRCTIPLLRPGDEIVVFTLLELLPGTVPLTFEVTSTTDDPNRRNNSTSVSIEVVRAPQIRLSLYYNAADPGEPVEYTSTITNGSGIAAEDVSFAFALPDGWSFERSLSPELRCEGAGREVRCTIDEIAPGAAVTSRFLLRAGTTPSAYQATPVTLTSAHGVFSEDATSAAYFATVVYRHLTVTTTADAGAGSLRNAIAEANAVCGAHPAAPCKIVFDIPGDGPYRTIRPESPLPALTLVATIDGSTQTRRHGDGNPDGPEIEINGSLLPAGSNGIEAAPSALFLRIQDLAINGFPGNGVVARSKGAAIERCYIGTDVTGRTAVPNGGRGVVIDSGTDYGVNVTLQDNVIGGNARSGVFIGSSYSATLIGNRIGATAGARPEPLGNGASGVYLGTSIYAAVVQKNLIAFNAEAGIAIAKSSAYVAMRGNSIYANGTLGIDYGLDLVTPTGYPTLTAARYDAGTNTTRIEGTAAHSSAANLAEVELFANTSPGVHGHGEGELLIGRVSLTGSTFAFEYPGDLRGRFISATLTRPNNYYPELLHLFTSEFSASLKVEGEAAAPIDRALTVPRGADLSLKLPGMSRLQAGMPQTVYVTVQNLGPGIPDDMVVELTSHTARLTPHLGGRCTAVAGGLRCVLGTQSWLSFQLEAPLGTDTIDLTGRVTSSLFDPDLSNNQHTVTSDVTTAPILELFVDSSGPVDPGATATYTVLVTHRTFADAREVEVRIPVPHGWSFVSGPADGWSCTAEEQQIVCRKPLMKGLSTEAFSVVVRAPSPPYALRIEGTRATITAAGAERFYQLPWTVAWQVYHLLHVTNGADGGDGSLRRALERANGECADEAFHCEIVFDADASATNGVVSIRPQRPFPEIAAHNIVIDARTQADGNPLGPDVELNGSQTPDGNGLDIVSGGSVMVRGLAVNGFPGHGVAFRFSRDTYNIRRVVADNYIGMDPTGRTAVPNGGRGVVVEGNPEERVNVDVIGNTIGGNARAGVFLDAGTSMRIAFNRINANGASGVFLGRVAAVDVADNEIAHNLHAGIAVDARATWSGIRRNALHDNGGLGVDHGVDLVTHNDDARRAEELPRFPVILSAVWDASARVTRIEGRIAGSRRMRPSVVELFANAAPDSTGYGESQRFLGEVTIPPSADEQPFTFTIADDLRGTVVTSTLSRLADSYGLRWTSEISLAVPVQ